MKRFRWQSVVLILLFLSLLFYFLYISIGRNKAGTLVGKEAPDFTLLDEDGQPLSLSSLHGKRIWLIFWMMNCEPCKKELDYVQRAGVDVPPSTVVAAVNLDTLPGPSQEWLKSLNPFYLTLFDPAQTTARLYFLVIFPANFFVNEQGIVLDYIAGFHPYLEEKAQKWMHPH